MIRARDMDQLVQRILKGAYAPLPEVYSVEVRQLVKMMLQTAPNKRPSVDDMLQMPFIRRRVCRLLDRYGPQPRSESSPRALSVMVSSWRVGML